MVTDGEIEAAFQELHELMPRSYVRAALEAAASVRPAPDGAREMRERAAQCVLANRAGGKTYTMLAAAIRALPIEGAGRAPVTSESACAARVETLFGEAVDLLAGWPGAQVDPRAWNQLLIYGPKLTEEGG